MKYEVINEFIDKDKTHYKVGDTYPEKGKPTKKRIEELSKEHPKYKRIFIKEVKIDKEPSSEK